MKKRLISLLLALVMCVTLCLPAFAAEWSSMANDVKLNRTIETIKEKVPNATIRIVDNTIHIVVEDISNVSALLPAKTSRSASTTIYSSTGGAFKNFSTPGSAILIPLTQVYMSADATDARLLQLSRPSFYHWAIGEMIAGYSASQISAMAATEWKISVPTSVIALLVAFTVWALSNLDYWSLESARDQSSTGKTSVLHTITSDGYYSLIYYPWNNNTCTTYGGYSATWYAGDYEF